MGRASFSLATTQIQDASSSIDVTGYRTLERLERVILDHQPSSPNEAIAMLDLVIPEVLAGGRSDGRDASALMNIRTMLAGL